MANKKKSPRRRIGSTGAKGIRKDFIGIATDWVLPVAGGALAANYADKLPYLKDNPTYVPAVALVGGVVGASMTKGFVQKAFLGVAASGAVGAYNQLTKDPANGAIGMPWKLSPRPFGGSGTVQQG